MSASEITFALVPLAGLKKIRWNDPIHFPFFLPLEDGSRWYTQCDEIEDANLWDGKKYVLSGLVSELVAYGLRSYDEISENLSSVFRDECWNFVLEVDEQSAVVKIRISSVDLKALKILCKYCFKNEIRFIMSTDNTLCDSGFCELIKAFLNEDAVLRLP